MNHEYDTLSEQYIPLAGSYHSRGMWYFRLYELKSAIICLFCLLIHIRARRGSDMDIWNTVFIGIHTAAVRHREAAYHPDKELYTKGSGHACHNFISTSNQFDMAVGLHA